MLECKDLVMNPSKDALEEILTGVKNMDRTFRFYQSAEINRAQENIKVSASKPRKSCLKCGKGQFEDNNNSKVMAKTKEVNHTGYSGDGMEKANEVNNIINKECEENEPNSVAKNEDQTIAEMNNTNDTEFEREKEKKTISIEPEKPAVGETLEYFLGIIEKDFCPTSHQNCPLKTRKEKP
ncbi:hypothetical protein C2G38_2297019 [Gigaspora rosea]|uniref:Uncharacterized protein n=1 Tax=Gigaspora rosea TaxID=44941 RepID=A0A397VQA4_9GLOM|nr:hypothetical protein C2G38_2297019 [Gigaspora rosea]